MNNTQISESKTVRKIPRKVRLLNTGSWDPFKEYKKEIKRTETKTKTLRLICKMEDLDKKKTVKNTKKKEVWKTF